MPHSRRDYWMEKIARNKARDIETTRVLRESDWRVLRVWEHELKAGATVAKRLRRVLMAKPNMSKAS